MKKTRLEKSGVIALRNAGYGKHIVYSLKSAPGRKINAIFRAFYVCIFSTGQSVGFRPNFYEFYNLDVYGIRTKVKVNEDDIYQVKFVDSFPFEKMDFDMGI